MNTYFYKYQGFHVHGKEFSGSGCLQFEGSAIDAFRRVGKELEDLEFKNFWITEFKKI